MSTEKKTVVKKSIYALALAAAIVATPAAFASAADTPPATRYLLVDMNGNVVGELVSESATPVRLRVIGISTAPRSAGPAPDTRSDRSFHPDYSKALTPGQMSAAWQAEIDRLFPPPLTGGG